MDLVPDYEAVLSSVEGVVGEMLDPNGCVCLGKHTEANLQQIHVYECDLCPVDKRWRETELCIR